MYGTVADAIKRSLVSLHGEATLAELGRHLQLQHRIIMTTPKIEAECDALSSILEKVVVDCEAARWNRFRYVVRAHAWEALRAAYPHEDRRRIRESEERVVA